MQAGGATAPAATPARPTRFSPTRFSPDRRMTPDTGLVTPWRGGFLFAPQKRRLTHAILRLPRGGPSMPVHRFTRRATLGCVTALPWLRPGPAWAASPEVFAENGLAIGGTDPVAYFQQARAVAGVPIHALMWRSATWTFASAATRDAFEMNPVAFAPQFGGYCAHALARGELSPTLPEAWAIYEGRLYLTHNLAARTAWAADPGGQIALATGHWPAILSS